MVLSNQELKQLQAVCLELVKEVDRICRKNKIEYTLDGGTLLGAVREHGFIPWDDDADIAMSRAEYEKFFEACKKDLDHERFFLQEHRTDPDYPWGYSKLRMNGTKLVQIGQEHLKFHNGIFVDLFVYDNVPNGFFSRKFHYAECYLIRKCQYSAVGKKSGANIGLRIIYGLLDLIPKSFVFSILEKIAMRTNKNRTELVRHLTYPYFRQECHYGMPAKCFEEYCDVKFEGQIFRIIKEYDEYLSLLYGDYMTPMSPNDIKYYPISEISF